jgi:hypothetical protein
MASRQEEKERRRQEREALERKANASAARSRRLQIVGGVVLGIAAIAVVVILIAGSGGGDSGGDTVQAAKVPIPKATDNAQAGNLEAAAKAAGCKLTNPAVEGREHTTSKVTYKTNPPTSGNHNPTPAEDGIYEAGNEPEVEHLVHSLEHGRIILWYKPGTPKATTDKLETVVGEDSNGVAGYKTLMVQDDTKMPYAVAVTAWGHALSCPTMNDKFFDAFRAFRARYVDKGPEFVP